MFWDVEVEVAEALSQEGESGLHKTRQLDFLARLLVATEIDDSLRSLCLQYAALKIPTTRRKMVDELLLPSLCNIGKARSSPTARATRRVLRNTALSQHPATHYYHAHPSFRTHRCISLIISNSSTRALSVRSRQPCPSSSTSTTSCCADGRDFNSLITAQLQRLVLGRQL